jgi:protein-disulfide isomerase
MTTRQERRDQARAERKAREQAALRTAQRRRRLRQLGAVVGVAVVVAVGLAVGLNNGSKQQPNAAGGAAVAGVADMRAMLQGIPQKGTSLGDPKAPRVLTEFADLQCPFCRAYTLDVLPQVIQRYVRTKKLRLELRLQHFIGRDSDVAARAAQAAATRDRMWNFVDLFYRNQGEENSGYVTDSYLSRLATAAGLPATLVVDGSRSAALEQPVLDAEAQARAAGLTSTPSFLIGPKAGQGKVLNVARLDIGSFAKAIDPELAR